MVDEVKEPVVETKEAAPEYSDLETKAMERGWKPKEQFEGDETEWRSAEIFLALDPFYKKIESQSKRLKDAEKTIALFSEHHKRVNDAAYQSALNALRQEKKEALENGDAEKVVAVEDKIDNLKEEVAIAKTKQAAAVQSQSQEIHPDFQNWINTNPWYINNSEMKEFADSIGSAYARSNVGKDPLEVLQYVQKKVKTAYPDQFKNPNREAPSAVEGSRPVRKSKDAEYALSDEETKTMNRFIRSIPGFTKEKYIADLKQIKEKEGV